MMMKGHCWKTLYALPIIYHPTSGPMRARMIVRAEVMRVIVNYAGRGAVNLTKKRGCREAVDMNEIGRRPSGGIRMHPVWTATVSTRYRIGKP